MSTVEQAADEIGVTVERIIEDAKHQMAARGFRAANELTNAVLHVLAGGRSGKSYLVPGTRVRYTASAAGEAPANRTGTLRLSFKRRSYANHQGNGMEVHAVTESDYRVSNGNLLGEMLEQGTPEGKIAPRPFKQSTIDRAMPAIERIFSQPYV